MRARPQRNNGKTPSSATPTAGSRLKMIHLNLLFVMVSSVGDENARIIGTFFRTNW